jgi:phosphopantothenoylcysteine decarboxylase/phosphopantothenate--cysteine ligase
MNTRMWQHPATQANLELIRARGVRVVGPALGELAEGETGLGRMSEPEQIAAVVEDALGVEDALAPGSMTGKHVLVSAGGTREPLDAVRYLGNRSSGRMGVALAAEARRRGAKVTLLAANLAVSAPAGVDVVDAPTAADLERELAARAAEADVVLMAAAVADYRPEAPESGKRPKGAEPWNLTLRPTTDILQLLGERERNGQVLVGFGAETGEAGRERKRSMLAGKHLDLVVYNDVGRAGIGFDATDNEVVLMTDRGEREVPRAAKTVIAAAVLDEVERLLAERQGGS